MRVGLFDWRNVGGKPASSLLRNGFELMLNDLQRSAAGQLLEGGAKWGGTRRKSRDTATLSLPVPSPRASAMALEGADGVLTGLSAGKIWLEMSSSDHQEVLRLGERVHALGADALDSPVSGGCHRAATDNIAIFTSGARAAFEVALPVLTTIGGGGAAHWTTGIRLGSQGSTTNYLACVHLIAAGEALMVAKRTGIDVAVAYEAIRI